ncbi:hypothetical protein PRUPE_8G133100 [Prunus persica]|uniref:Uncharacterized protein n=1 Tax=Prunus persica TaxID=3760 RepID=M5W763_PRUPE|nr:hypothetical protein PRUPE_8G133100 [Prunus persica]
MLGLKNLVAYTNITIHSIRLLTLPSRFWITKKKHEFVSNNVYPLRLYLRKLLMHRKRYSNGDTESLEMIQIDRFSTYHGIKLLKVRTQRKTCNLR